MNKESGTSAKVVIINQHSVNVGDEAAGYALLEKLNDDYRIESIDIIYNGSEAIPCPPKAENKVRHDLDLSLKRMGYLPIAVFLLTGIRLNDTVKNFCAVIENADAVFVAPGGANIGIYKSWRYLVRLLFAVKLGKTPIFHWNTIGASGSAYFDYMAKKVLDKSKIYVREKKAAEYIESIGLHAELGPDTAFLLKPVLGHINTNKIAFVPSELDSWHPFYKKQPINEYVLHEYVPAIGRFANEYGYQIDVIPHLRDETEQQFNESVCLILRELGCTVKLRTDIKDFRDYDTVLAESAIVIGMRYHSAVLAAKNYRPFIALAYENKALEVGRYTDMGRFCVDLNGDRPNGGQVYQLLEELYHEREKIPPQLRRICEDILIPRASFILETELRGYKK